MVSPVAQQKKKPGLVASTRETRAASQVSPKPQTRQQRSISGSRQQDQSPPRKHTRSNLTTQKVNHIENEFFELTHDQRNALNKRSTRNPAFIKDVISSLF